MEVRSIFGGGEVHLDVIEGLALAEIVVIDGGEQTSSVAPHDRLQISTMDVEGERFESVHFSCLAGDRDRNIDLKGIREIEMKPLHSAPERER